MRTLATLLLTGLVTAVSAGNAQQLESPAMAAALRHVRGDLPERGRVALVVKQTPITSEVSALAVSVGAEVRPESELKHCAWTDERWSCRFRDVVGAFGIKHVERMSSGGVRVTLFTTSQVTSTERSWLYTRTYEVEVLRDRDGTWKVGASRLVSQT